MQGDSTAAQEHLAWSRGKPREYDMVAAQAQMAAFSGKLRRAGELYRQARDMADRAHLAETAASVAASDAATAAAFEDVEHARRATEAALALASGRMVKARAFVALPMVGYGGGGQTILNEALRRYPDDTLLVSFFDPLVRGAVELRRGNPQRTIELLEAARPYELGPMPFWPVYLRGLAYLALRDGVHAAAEFAIIRDRRGVDPFRLYTRWPISASRAHTLSPVTGPPVSRTTRNSSGSGVMPTPTCVCSAPPGWSTTACRLETGVALNNAPCHFSLVISHWSLVIICHLSFFKIGPMTNEKSLLSGKRSGVFP